MKIYPRQFGRNVAYSWLNHPYVRKESEIEPWGFLAGSTLSFDSYGLNSRPLPLRLTWKSYEAGRVYCEKVW
jgi:hypothetical protein